MGLIKGIVLQQIWDFLLYRNSKSKIPSSYKVDPLTIMLFQYVSQAHTIFNIILLEFSGQYIFSDTYSYFIFQIHKCVKLKLVENQHLNSIWKGVVYYDKNLSNVTRLRSKDAKKG